MGRPKKVVKVDREGDKEPKKESKSGGAFDKLMLLVKESFGENAIYCPDSFSPPSAGMRTSTGNPFLDFHLGGGVPQGRIILISGPFSSGKTYFVQKCMAVFNLLKKRIAFLDEERTFDKEWAEKCGMEMSNCYVASGEYSEQTMDLGEVLIGSGEFGAVAVDSLASMIPKKTLEEAHEDHQMGIEAKLNAKFFRKILAAQDKLERANKIPPTVFVINQLRKKIGVMFGNPETLPGGEAQRFYASIWMDFRATETILDKADQIVGMYFTFDVKKNKTAPRRKGTVSMFIADYQGMKKGDWDIPAAVMDLGVTCGVIEKEGKYYASPLFERKYTYSQLWKAILAKPSMERAILGACQVKHPEVKIAYAPRAGTDTVVEIKIDEEEDAPTKIEKARKNSSKSPVG